MTYDQRWPARADAVLQDLADALGSLVGYAEHVGSTSVPQLADGPWARDCAWPPHGAL